MRAPSPEILFIFAARNAFRRLTPLLFKYPLGG